MQSIASVSRGMARIAFMRGSPQRIQYSPGLLRGALLTLLALAILTQVYVFRSNLVGVSLYVFTIFVGLYLGAALLSRRTTPSRLRSSLQAALLLIAAAHAVVLLAGPMAALSAWLPLLVAAALVVIVTVALTNCVHFALGGRRAAAIGRTVVFVFAVAAFYVTMQRLVTIALA